MITVIVPDEPVINRTTGFGRLRARSVKQTKTSVTLQWNIIKDADGCFIYENHCNTGTKSYKYKKPATITNGATGTWTQKQLPNNRENPCRIRLSDPVQQRELIDCHDIPNIAIKYSFLIVVLRLHDTVSLPV